LVCGANFRKQKLKSQPMFHVHIKPKTLISLRSKKQEKRARWFSTQDELVKYREEYSGKVAYVTLNNPKKRNALSLPMLASLNNHFKNIKQNSTLR
jgi:hypothetical protein